MEGERIDPAYNPETEVKSDYLKEAKTSFLMVVAGDLQVEKVAVVEKVVLLAEEGE